MIKNIFIYWDQGFDNAPLVVKRCLLSWHKKNPTWNIIQVTSQTIKNLIDINQLNLILNNKSITKTSFSDVLRVYLLEKYGGCWCDATTFCVIPLDDWLPDMIRDDFFAFRLNINNRPISSWFIYADKQHYLITEWKKKVCDYLNTVDFVIGDNKIDFIQWNLYKHNLPTYFWFHYLFSDLCNEDNKIRDIINKLNACALKCHIVQDMGLVNKVHHLVKKDVLEKKNYIYKLSYKYEDSAYNNNCNLAFVLDTINVKLIHIGKCGGTTLLHYFNFVDNQYHLKRDYLKNESFVIWIRNPLSRFVSAFNFSLSLIELDTSLIDKNKLTIDNCLAPGRIYRKMTYDTDITFDERYDYLIRYFKTPNYLAESLSSDNEEIKQLAFELMNYDCEHINKGIGWYLYNGIFIDNHKDKILFVGSIENMETDIYKLADIMSVKITGPIQPIRKNNTTLVNKELSPTAINNLIEFYHETDYLALRKLLENNFISKKLFDSYYTYS